jgi:ribonucleotide monophosphatase NagD (HAD superfamily)
MKYTRTKNTIRFSTRLDAVRIENVGTAIKVFLDGADREAVYVFSPSNVEAVAAEIGVEAKDEFLDFVEAAIATEKAEELVSAVIQKSTTEFFWMNMDQIDRFLIGKEQPGEIDRE